MRPFVIAMIAVLATATAGCGRDEGPEEDRSVTATPESETPPEFDLIEDGTLIVGSNIPYSPFEEGDPPDYEGFDIDLINEIAGKLDLDLEIEPTPFDTLLKGGEGRFDLAISAVEITPARERRVDFSDPYYVSSLGLLVREDSEVATVKDIRPSTIVAVETGTDGETYANQNTRDSEIRAFPSADDAFNALFSKQVDVVIADGPIADDASGTREGLEVAEFIATDEEYGIVVPQGDTELLKAVNEALREAKDEGVIDGLYDEYFGIEAPVEIVRTRTGER